MQRSKTRKSKYLMQRFIPYYKPYWKVLFADLVCASFSTLGDIILPLMVRYITMLAINDLTSLTVNIIVMIGIAYMLIRLVDIVANYYMQSIGHIMGSKIETDMRTALFNHLQKLSFRFYNQVKIGQIMSRITSDLNDVTEFAHHFPEEMFIAAIKIVVSFLILSTINIPLTLIIFSIVPVMIYCASKYNHQMRQAFAQTRHHIGELNAQVEDSLLGIRVVKSFANEDIEIEKFDQGNQLFLKLKKKMYYNMAGFQAVVRFFDALMYIAVVVAGGLFLINGQINASDYVAYLMYVTTLLASIRRMVEFMEQFQRGMTGIERFVEVMDADIEIFDKPDAIDLKAVKGQLSFEHVSFRYDGDDSYVLKDVSFQVQPGQSVAFVGPSGGGKTTITNLIQRFYDVESGRILIDGQDIKDIKLKSLRNNIGVVQQDVYLFSGTVFENIEYGRPGASKEDVIKAAKLAGAHDFISQLDKGYDTYVGERGTKLSGGQKQRISIARVFLKNPPILILDEATSALDNENEKIVQESLEYLAQGRTTFTIAHRLTTIKNADLIMVLTDEGIVEQGSHETLMAKKGLYYELYGMYLQLT